MKSPKVGPAPVDKSVTSRPAQRTNSIEADLPELLLTVPSGDKSRRGPSLSYGMVEQQVRVTTARFMMSSVKEIDFLNFLHTLTNKPYTRILGPA